MEGKKLRFETLQIHGGYRSDLVAPSAKTASKYLFIIGWF